MQGFLQIFLKKFLEDKLEEFLKQVMEVFLGKPLGELFEGIRGTFPEQFQKISMQGFIKKFLNKFLGEFLGLECFRVTSKESMDFLKEGRIS